MSIKKWLSVATMATGATFALAPLAASAATVGGSVLVKIYQSTNTDVSSASATDINLVGNYLGSTIYSGGLNFFTDTSQDDPADTTTIGTFLDTGGGSYTLNASIANLQLSMPDLGSSTATTTFFEFLGLSKTGFDFTVTHDDGFSFFDDGTALASSAAPTTVQTTNVDGFDGGQFRLIYAASNGDPSVLHVEGDGTLAPVPLPAAGFLLFGALGGLAALRRRRKPA